MTEINDLSPFAPVHPGCILREELKARRISQKAFAERIGLQATHLCALIHGTRNITPAVAAKLEVGLAGIPAEMWLGLQNSYNIDVQRKQVNSSFLVSGYSFERKTAGVLAEPEEDYEGKIRVTMTVPMADRGILTSLASRLGWRIDQN